jgi:hypothetical protein
MPSKTGHRRRRRVGGSKRRRTYRKRHYGRGIYDYLPSAENIPGYNFYKGVKAGYDAVSSIGAIYDNNKPEISTVEVHAPASNIPKPPPLPTLPKSIQRQKRAAEERSDLLSIARKIKPISFIDRALHHLGLRDKVRSKLSQSNLGKALVSGADTAIKFGLGRRRRRVVHRRRAYGGSKTRSRRRTHRRGRGSIVV